MKSSKFKKRLYRNIGYTLLMLFSFYICYKTYQTQQIKQRRNKIVKFREGFKERNADADDEDDDDDDDEPQSVNDVGTQLLADCNNKCITDKSQCKDKCSNSADDKACRKTCRENVKPCKKLCKGVESYVNKAEKASSGGAK